jgi:hypothetical protein
MRQPSCTYISSHEFFSPERLYADANADVCSRAAISGEASDSVDLYQLPSIQ